APLGDHLAGQLGGADQVVVGAGGDDAEDELLGAPAAHAHDQRVLDVVLPVDVLLVDGELLGAAAGHADGEDRHLVHRVGVGQHGGAHRVPGLVVGDDLLLGV